jgi:hypothetical protein
MSAPATLMFTQIKAILTTAVQSVAPAATILTAQPQTWGENVAVLAYFWKADAVAIEKAGPGQIRYTHPFPIHVLVRNTGTSDEMCERTLSDIDAALFDAFMGNRRLNATAATSTLRGGDGKMQTGPTYITHNRMEFRHSFWTLMASEDRVYNYVNG